ncbi:MAG: hypothetical protein AAF267_10410 [Deinococcota bacterium]
MPAPLPNHLHKRMPKDYADVGSAEMHLSDTYAELDRLHTARGSVPEKQVPGTQMPNTKLPDTKAPSTKVPSTKVPSTKASGQRTPEASPQQCIASLRRGLLGARLALLEHSSRLVRSYSKGQSQHLQHGVQQRFQGHMYTARVTRLEQQLDYLERLQGAAKHANQGSLNRPPDDGIFEACEQAIENALYLLEHVPTPSYMVDLNEVVWRGLTSMVATGCVETGITMTLPIILGNPQLLTWLMTELLAGSALSCLQVTAACQQDVCKNPASKNPASKNPASKNPACNYDAKPLLTVDCLDTATNWRLNVSVSNAICTTSGDTASQIRPALGYVKHAIGLLEGDFWVESASDAEKTFSLTLPKRLSFA